MSRERRWLARSSELARRRKSGSSDDHSPTSFRATVPGHVVARAEPSPLVEQGIDQARWCVTGVAPASALMEAGVRGATSLMPERLGGIPVPFPARNACVLGLPPALSRLDRKREPLGHYSLARNQPRLAPPCAPTNGYSSSFSADSRIVVSSDTQDPAVGFCATVVQLRSRSNTRPCPVASSSSSA